jgi:integrase/recombinase XerD
MSTPVITIYVRHSVGCKYAGEEFARRCDCRKHLRWTANGRQQRLKTGSRSWEEAEEVKHRLIDQLSGKETVSDMGTARTVQECMDIFLADKSVQGFGQSSYDKYKLELGRLVAYLTGVGIFNIKLVTRDTLTAYCAGWPAMYPSAATRCAVRDRLNSFFHFCHNCAWIDRQPKTPPMRVPESETQPLERDEFDRLVASAATVAFKDTKDAARVRCLFLLQRWSGLAIRDALTLPKTGLQCSGGVYRVVTSRQKTGTDVSVPIPTAVALELLSLPNDNPEYFFWDGKQDPYLCMVSMGARVKRCFVQAGLDDGQHMKSHRLRDTFAVELLQKGVPMEEVSKLLGHTSIRTTEKHYAKWVKGRQDRLDKLVIDTWDIVAK